MTSLSTVRPDFVHESRSPNGSHPNMATEVRHTPRECLWNLNEYFKQKNLKHYNSGGQISILVAYSFLKLYNHKRQKFGTSTLQTLAEFNRLLHSKINIIGKFEYVLSN